MDFESLGCEDCIVYKVRHQLDEADKCPDCGKMTFRWRQNDFGTMCVECSECGCSAAVDMNTPCELEHGEIFVCHIAAESVSHEKYISISKIADMTAVEIFKLMKNEGIMLEADFYEMCKKLIYLDKEGIPFTVEPYDPRDKYPDVKDCGYPYRAIKEDW